MKQKKLTYLMTGPDLSNRDLGVELSRLPNMAIWNKYSPNCHQKILGSIIPAKVTPPLA